MPGLHTTPCRPHCKRCLTCWHGITYSRLHKTMAGRGKKKKKTSASGSVARGRNISRLRKKFTKNPASEEDFVKLWDVYLAAEAWEALAELLEARIAALTDGADKVRALLRLGNLYDEKLGEPRRAVDAYQRVLNIEPRNRRAIWSLAMLYHDLEEWNKVIEIYLLQIDLAESPEEKLSLRTQLAQIYEERLQQDDEALLEYIRAVRLAPETVRILLNMEKLAFRTASFRELLSRSAAMTPRSCSPSLPSTARTRSGKNSSPSTACSSVWPTAPPPRIACAGKSPGSTPKA